MRLLQAARLSRLGDASTGLDKQDLDAQTYATLGGHELVATAADTDVSGDTDPWSRPELGPWLTDPTLISQYDGIVASHVDRLARSTVYFMRLLHWADEHGKRIITTGEQGIDFSSPVGKLLGYIISWLGEQELAAIKRRSKRTQTWLMSNDYLVGLPPFGYRVIAKDNHKTLEPDPTLVPYLRGMIDGYLSGDTLTAICEWLDSEGVSPPRGRIWNQKSVSRMLRNPILYGRRKDKDGKTVLKVEPVIDLTTWRRLQHKLDNAPTRRGAASGDTALLTNVIYCGKCRRAMYRFKTTTKNKDGSRHFNWYYRCMGTSREPSTCRNMIPMSDIESWVSDQLTGEVIGSDEVIERVTLPGEGHADVIEQLEQDLRELNFDAPDFLERQATLLAERKRLLALPVEPDRTVARHTGVTIAEHWRWLDDAGKRAYLLDAEANVYAVRVPNGQEVGRPSRYPRLAASIAL